MRLFLSRHESKVKGVLSGFDRVRFRGTIRWLSSLHGMGSWLGTMGVLLKCFTSFAKGMTDQVRETSHKVADASGRPLEYLSSSSIRKEDYAREIAERDNITSGLVCVLTAVEPCMTFKVGPNPESQRLELRYVRSKCLHHYFYLIDPYWGWLNVRLQTWLPFTIQIVANGRERLAHQLVKRGIEFERRGNCFVDIADIKMAQELMNQHQQTNWPKALNRITARVHQSHRTLFGSHPLNYYWSADETEWATDVMFRSESDLSAIYPRFVRQAINDCDGNDVLRFLGRPPHIKRLRSAEVTSHIGKRVEGTRVKHAINRNSIKMYDKQGSVLRIETTINSTREMKAFRASEDNPNGPKSWQKLRKGVADLKRRTQISQTANERYLESLASVDTESTLAEATASVCQRTTWKGRSVRALNPLQEEDAKLLQAIHRGEFAILGFRNRDLREHLFGDSSTDPRQIRRETAKITRMIRMLRAHGLVQKVSKTHRYVVTTRGSAIITALAAARNTDLKTLTSLAA